MKQDVVEIYRYIRFEDPLYGAIHVWGNEIDPHSGVTFLIRLDYVKNTFTFTLSVCDKENFVKTKGRELARARMDNGEYLEFQLDKLVIPEEGSVSYALDLVAAVICKDGRTTIPMLDYCSIDDFKRLLSIVTNATQRVYDITNESIFTADELHPYRKRSRVLR